MSNLLPPNNKKIPRREFKVRNSIYPAPFAYYLVRLKGYTSGTLNPPPSIRRTTLTDC